MLYCCYIYSSISHANSKLLQLFASFQFFQYPNARVLLAIRCSCHINLALKIWVKYSRGYWEPSTSRSPCCYSATSSPICSPSYCLYFRPGLFVLISEWDIQCEVLEECCWLLPPVSLWVMGSALRLEFRPMMHSAEFPYYSWWNVMCISADQQSWLFVCYCFWNNFILLCG